jgi:ABC transport system ATP-binding/permease protein
MKLIIEDDEGRKTVVPFVRDEISIGRKDGNTIRLTERNVSRRHARLTRGNGHVFVEDLGSYNGVRVNGDRIEGRSEIREGDLIEIGDYNLAIQIEATDGIGPVPSGPEPVTTPQAQSLEMQRQAAPAPPATPAAAPAGPKPAPAPAAAAAHPQPVPQPAAAPPPQPAGANGAATASPAPPAAPPPKPAAPATQVVPPTPSVLSPTARSADGAGAPRRESTAVIRVDIESLNRSEERQPLQPDQRPRLVVLTTEYAGRTFEIDQSSASIGRTDDNDVALDHRSMSRNHCRVYLDQDGLWKILDRGSANGVRVNGEEYGLIDLRRGDVIELGHVKIRFCDAGDDFVYTEEIGRAYAAGDVAAPRRKGTGGSKLPLYGGVGVVAVLAIIGLVWILGPGKGADVDSDPIAITSIPTPSDQDGPDLQSQVREAIQAAGDAAEDERWNEAIEAYERALSLDPTNTTAQQGLERVQPEAEAKRAFDGGISAVDSEDWELAWQRFAEVPEESVYYDRIAPHREAVRQGYLGVRVARAQEYLREREWDEAIEEAEAVLALSPNHSRASDIVNRAERAKAREERQVAQQTPRRPPRQPRTQKAATTTQDRGNQAEEAQEAFQAGFEHHQRGEFRQAVAHLERALRLDPRGQSTAHALLGTCYARLGDSQRAAMHYRRFLETNPNHRQAPQVRQILEEFERYSQEQ